MSDFYQRPSHHLAKYSVKYPDAWKFLDGMRVKRGTVGPRGFIDWPDWCFLPNSAASRYFEDRHGAIEADALTVAMMAIWRTTKGVYEFDGTLFDSVWNSNIQGDIPTEILHRLPEYCPYILTPNRTFFGHDLYGFYACLDYNIMSGQQELRFLLDTPDMLLPHLVYLGHGGITEGLEAVKSSIVSNGRRSDKCLEVAFAELTPSLVSCLLYLCSQTAEVLDASGSGRQPSLPKSKRTKQGDRVFAAERPTRWEVGFRIGAALRRAYAQAEGDGGVGGKKRPHIRRAHWHTYWTGEREGQNRQAVLKWMPPIAINVEDVDDLVTTVRPVE